MTPEVTIITPTYQQTDTRGFLRMLHSVQSQYYKNWEHLIFSDGALEPATEALVRDQHDARQRYDFTRYHRGGWGAHVRQEVMQGARGKYLCFLDDDNILLPEYLSTMLAALRLQPEAHFAICTCLHFGPLSAEWGKPPVYLTPRQPRLQAIDTIQVLVRATSMSALGWQEPDSYMSDGLTFTKLGQLYPFALVPELLAVHL